MELGSEIVVAVTAIVSATIPSVISLIRDKSSIKVQREESIHQYNLEKKREYYGKFMEYRDTILAIATLNASKKPEQQKLSGDLFGERFWELYKDHIQPILYLFNIDRYIEYRNFNAS